MRVGEMLMGVTFTVAGDSATHITRPGDLRQRLPVTEASAAELGVGRDSARSADCGDAKAIRPSRMTRTGSR